MSPTTLLVIVQFFVIAAGAIPPSNDLIKNFQASVHQQNLQSILVSIEERLRNLDNIYAMHLSPTLESKLEQYQRRLEAIDTKIIRLESLVMLNLDKISENISTKNFKDEISKTNHLKKIDAIYEGLSHRLSYLDRKFETNTLKTQNKLETTITRLEKMDEGFTKRYEDIEIELSDATVAIDDLKTTCLAIEENIINNTNENFEVSIKEQNTNMKDYNEKSQKLITELFANLTKQFSATTEAIGVELEFMNTTEDLLHKMKDEIKKELNEYAIKVAEMNLENWKLGTTLTSRYDLLETIASSTKIEMQNGLRALMLLVGKNSNKNHNISDDKLQMDEINKKLDVNFEKVFTAQDLFMDNCYRLQMDESQIESKISVILEKLMETFEKKTAIELKDIKNLEKLIKIHDSHISRNLYQISANIVTVFEKITKDHHEFEKSYKQITDQLTALFSLLQEAIEDENTSTSAKNGFLHHLSEIEQKIINLGEQEGAIANSVDDIKHIVQNLNYEQNSSKIVSDYWKKISDIIGGIDAKINTAYRDYYNNQTNIAEEMRNSSTIYTNNTFEGKSLNVDEIIRNVFGLSDIANRTEFQNIVFDDIDANTANSDLPPIDIRSNFGIIDGINKTADGGEVTTEYFSTDDEQTTRDE